MHNVLKLLGFGKNRDDKAPIPNETAAELPNAPFEIMAVRGELAFNLAMRLRRERQDVFPIVFGDKDELEMVLQQTDFNKAPFDEYLQLSLEIDIPQWVAQKFEAEPELYETDASDSGSTDTFDHLTIATDILTGKPKPEVFIGLIPVKHPWQVPAFIRYGDWNDCPGPEVHVAFFKHWYERYEAVVIGISNDTIEFTVERPPTTMEDAMQLAHEQFIYCSDIVQQGTGTEENLATAILNGKFWYFWWD